MPDIDALQAVINSFYFTSDICSVIRDRRSSSDFHAGIALYCTII